VLNTLGVVAALGLAMVAATLGAQPAVVCETRSARLTKAIKSIYEVTVAANAKAALDAIERQHPDLVLMDIQLPGIDGLQLVRRLRADVTSQRLLIIAVTAYRCRCSCPASQTVGTVPPSMTYSAP
jgi:CheY-like chemotaxis protein